MPVLGFNSIESIIMPVLGFPPDFPPEITINILSRLPVDTVLNCRRVCKIWKSLIPLKDKYFLNLHLQQLLKQQDGGVDGGAGGDESGDGQYNSKLNLDNNLSFIFLGIFKSLYTLEFDDRSYEKVTRINMRFPSDSSSLLESIGSCNGLVCLAMKSKPDDCFNPAYVCNPITREFVSLPEDNEFGKFEILSGFGYVRSTNEYKVVRIMYYGKDVIANGGVDVAGHVEVYTLGSGGGWRDKGETNLSFVRGSRTVYLNGVCYWFDSTGTVVAFNLENEEFQMISPPRFLDPYNVNQSNKLCTLGGCLCMFQQPVGYIGNPEIWVLKKVVGSSEGKEQTGIWSDEEIKLPSILSWGLYRQNMLTAMPFALTKRGEILFKFYSNGKTIASYDPKTATPRNNWMLDKVLASFGGIPHVNSFVSLKALGEEKAKVLDPVRALTWFRR